MDLVANPEQLKAIAREVQSECQAYMNEIAAAFTIIEDLRTGWTGEDNQKYTSVLLMKRPEIESVAKVVNEYAIKIQEATNRMERAQAEIAGQAGGMLG